MTFDSAPDTYAHIERVRDGMFDVVTDLMHRARVHDHSKLEEPEKTCFDEFTPRLAETTYGSPEYEAALARMGTALQHHYANNDHHPEHHAGGIHEMSLVHLIEMLADWRAAAERHSDGSLLQSIEHNADRFGYGVEMTRLLRNTAIYLGWM